jgi:hypothetical protein
VRKFLVCVFVNFAAAALNQPHTLKISHEVGAVDRVNEGYLLRLLM